MDKELLQKALEEAYASAPQDKIPLDTIEIDHPSFAQPLRVVRWPITGPEAEVFRLRLEDDAPKNPGEIVEFLGFPFELSLPDSSTESEGVFELRVSVHQEIDQALMNAVQTRGIIVMHYRQYVKGMELDGPSEYWRHIEIQHPRREGGDIIADGAVLGWMKRPFGDLYTPSKYPGLVTGQ